MQCVANVTNNKITTSPRDNVRGEWRKSVLGMGQTTQTNGNVGTLKRGRRMGQQKQRTRRQNNANAAQGQNATQTQTIT